MISYMDRTFCKSDCKNEECPRFVSGDIAYGSSCAQLPLSLSDFSKNCADYISGTPK